MNQVYSKNWQNVNVSVTAYIHELRNFRYNWHEDEYELDIILTGRAEFVRGEDYYTLESGDLILVNPGVGHASFSLQENTLALVIRISERAFGRLLELGKAYRFDYVTDEKTRNTAAARKIRYYSTLLLRSLSGRGRIADEKARGSLELLTCTIAEEVPGEVIPFQREDLYHQQAIRVITSYMEEHYREKITLDDLAKLTKYNRTYISTIFRQTVGIRFYDYLIRIRITNALYELADERKTLTQVALDNGFPDLKNFTAKLKEAVHLSPSRYRELIVGMKGDFIIRDRKYYSPEDPLAKPVLDSFYRKHA